MNLDQDLRTMLRARAEGVAAAPVIPHSTLRRVRVRKTLMTGSVAAVVVALVVGGFAASRSLSNDAAPIRPADENEMDLTVVDFPPLTETFVSPTNGFSIKHPDRAAADPARDLWGLDGIETGEGAYFQGASTEIPDGVSIDEWVDDYSSPAGCDVPRSRQVEITIDGRSGWIWECQGAPDTDPSETIDTGDTGEIHATVVAGGRLYLFTLLHMRSDGRAVFDAFAATIDLTPETAVDVPGPTETFVSPTYGFSVEYSDRQEGPLEPAKDHWDPGDEPSHDAFDVVGEFRGASTEIPEGVAIDELVADHVSLDGCFVPPRSQQAEITIDGHPGRIWECSSPTSTANEIGATVVAGGRIYLFTLWHSRMDGRAFFDAIVDTIDLIPETATVP
jgi:hypothetical protein